MKKSSNDYEIYNIMEHVADQAIERVLAEDSLACSCQLCRDDAKSCMLNNLPPLYSPVIAGEKLRKPELEELDTPLFNKVMVECFKAVMKVKNSPRHENHRSGVQNSTESIVIHALRDVLTREKIHLDRDELSMVVANVLNDLKPQYTTTRKGDVFCRTAEMDAGYLAKVYTSIYNALKELHPIESHG
ncbi:MAG: late competence development ComFB family protein [Firmicutes bacterium]|nr:late competence development ComFB family protein [Bacillota bacterium]